jgi:hypothetical protein
MDALTLQKQPTINDGMQVTFQGDPGICTYWEVVAGGSGSLKDGILVTDINGVAVNQYTSSTSPGDIGTNVTIRVTHA